MTYQNPIPAIDWGPKPSVNDWYNVDRRSAMPPVLLTQQAVPKGHRGICAGREFELEQMNSYFQAQQAALNAGELEKRDYLAMLITGAPGVGKSTLLEEFAMRCAGQGMTCIPLNAESLHRETWLVDGLIDYAYAEYTETEVKLEQLAHRIEMAATEHVYAPNATATLIGAATAISLGTVTLNSAPAAIDVGAVASDGIARSIVDVARKMRAQRQLLAGEIERKKPATAKEALEMLDEKYEGRFLFIIDECHNLAMDAESHINVKKNIRAVTDPIRRGTGHRIGGGAVLAGLGDATRLLDRFHLPPATVIRLSEFEEDSARATIEHQLSKAVIDVDRLRRVAPEWSQKLAHDFAHWPQQCATAGETARCVLEMTEPGALLHTASASDPERLEWVRTATARQIIELYSAHWSEATDKGLTSTAIAVVALANRTANHMPKDSVSEVIWQVHAGRLAGQTLTEVNLHVEQTINHMVRTGFICENPQTREAGREITHWELGIPSLRRFVSENTTDNEAILAYAAADATLARTAPRYLK